VGAEHPGLDPGGARNLVDLQHLVEQAERDDDGRSSIFRGGKAPDDRGPTPIGDGDIPVLIAPLECGDDLFFGPRVGHDVRRVRKIEVEGANPFGEMGTVGVTRPVVRGGRTPAGNRVGNLDARGSQFRVLGPRHRPCGNRGPEPLREVLGELRALGVGRLLRFHTPRPERLAVSGGHGKILESTVPECPTDPYLPDSRPDRARTLPLGPERPPAGRPLSPGK